MRKEDITEELVVKTAMKGMVAYIHYVQSTGNTVSLDKCMNKAMDNLRGLWRETLDVVDNAMRRFGANESKRLDEFVAPYLEAVRNECSKVIMRDGVLSTSNDIKAISAESIISDYLNDAGITNFSLYRQRYRFKVYIPVRQYSVLSAPIKFSMVYDQLPKLVDAFHQVESMIDTFGKDFKVR